MALPHDSGGFLIGERVVSAIDAVKSDTDAILALLRAGMNRSGEDAEATRRAQEEIARNTRQTREVGQREEAGGESDGTITRRAQEGGSRRLATAPSPGAGPATAPSPGAGPATAPSPGAGPDAAPSPGAGPDAAPSPGAGPDASPDRARNERGQYTGDGDSESDAKKQSWLSKMVDAVKGRFGVGTPDADNVDPAVTAMQEAAQLMTPIAKVGGMLFGAGRWLLGKKRDDIPKEQRRHNKLIEKLLSKIARLRGGGDGLGGPILGGFIGGLVERFGPMLAAAVPMLGGLLFKGLGLALAWKGGQAIGTWIYKTFQPQIDAVADAIGGAVKSAIDAYDSAVSKVTSWIESVVNAYDTAVRMASDGIEWIANKLGWLKDKGSAVVDAVTNFFKGDSLDPNRAPAKTFTDEKAAAIAESAKRIGMSPNDLATMISFETGGTFDPAKRNLTSGATGLIQFMPATAKGLGTSTEALAKMSFADQMKYVEKYLIQAGIGKNGKTSLADAYDAVMGVPKGGYSAISENANNRQAYYANPAWDVDGDGVIKPGEAVTGKKFQAHRANYFPAGRTISMPPPFTPAYPAGMGVLKIPPAPKIQQQVGGKDAAIPVVIQGSVSDISQNVSDRNLAHLITGGLGMDYRGQ